MFRGGCAGLWPHLSTDVALMCHLRDPRWLEKRHRFKRQGFLNSGGCLYRDNSCSRFLTALERLVLRFTGFIALLNITMSLLVWLPSSLIFVCYSFVFPLTQLPQCFDADNQGERLLLPCTLSFGYFSCLLCLLALAPLVSRFQLTRADLRNSKGFPEAFYDEGVIRDIYKRYLAALARVDVSRALRSKVGRYNAMEIISYLDEETHGTPYS